MPEPELARDPEPLQSRNVRAAHLFSWLYIGAVAGFVLFVAWYALSAHYSVPNRDDWRILADLFSTSALEWIFTDQNGHWIPGTLSLVYLDYTWFDGHMHLLAAASVINVAIGIAALAVMFVPSIRTREPMALAIFACATFLFAWSAARFDLAWGMNQGTLMAAMWTLVSLTSLGCWVERQHTPDAPGGSMLLVTSVGSATAATFSQGLGFSCWAGVLFVLIAARAPWRIVGALGAAALSTLLFYQSTLTERPRQSLEFYFEHTLSFPINLAERALAYVGSPVSQILVSSGAADPDHQFGLSVVCGAIGVAALFVTGLSFMIKRVPLTRIHVAALGLPTTALVGGLMVSLNRVFFRERMIDIRFATWSTLFWIGLIALAATQLVNRRKEWVEWMGGAAIIIVSGLALFALGDARAEQADRREKLAILRAMHLVGLRWDYLAGGTTLNRSPDRVYKVVERMKRDRKNIFDSPAANWIGTPITDTLTLVSGSRCAGAITDAKRIDIRVEHALLLSGWGELLEGNDPPEQLLVTDKTGIIVGMGATNRGGTASPPVSLPDREYPWIAFVPGRFAEGTHQAYALLDDGRSACPLAARQNPRD